MKVLVSGGSGFLGINMIRKLFEHKIEDITVLDLSEFDYPEISKITFLKGDIRDKTAVNLAMQGITHVIHCAAALPLYKNADIISTDVDGTRNMLEAAYDQKVERFVHISSTAVYGIPDHHPILESDRICGVGIYGEAKILAEKLCFNYRNKGMVIPVIRPKSFIGPERLGVFSLFYDWAKDGHAFPMIGSGKNRYQLLDVDDLTDAIWSCMIGDERVVNDTFNIGAKLFTTMKEDYQAVLDFAGYGKKIIGFPAAPVIWLLRILEFLHLSPLYKWVYETACEDSFVSIEKAEKCLGFAPKYSNKEALLRNFKWYLDNLEKFRHTSGVSHRVLWKQGVLGILKRFF